MSIELQNVRQFKQSDFPVALEYESYFYKASDLQLQGTPLGFISNNLQNVRLI